MVKAFVTGGSGFLGRELIAALRAAGVAVTALARSSAAEQAVRAAGAEPAPGDLDDAAALRAGLAGCDVAFHSAAKVDQFGRRADFVRVNVDGTQRLLDAARAAGARRVVHISTEAVLCGRPIVRVDESVPRPERPIGLYAETKGLAEERVRAANGGGLETVIVRPRFIWGRGDTSVLPKIAEAARRGQLRWVAGGHYPTSTCHVRNVCEGALLAAERGAPGATYFLTDGEPVEMRAFLSRQLAALGVTPPTAEIPRWLVRAAAVALEAAWRVLPLSGEPPITRMGARLFGDEVTVSDAKARRELGYLGRVSVDEGIAEMGR